MDKFQEYLNNLENPPVSICNDLASNVRKFWKDICFLTNNKIKLPIAGPREDEFDFEWQKGQKILTITLYKNEKKFEWFFHDREKHIIDGSEDICDGIPLNFFDWLKDFEKDSD